jgi:hypothetical protein
MKKMLITGLLLTGFIATSIALVSGASAADRARKLDREKPFLGEHPGFEQMIEDKAEFLGVNSEQLKKAFENKTVKEFLEQNGITQEQIHEKMQERMTKRLQEKGLSETEINEYVSQMKERQTNCNGEGFKMGLKKGMHKGLR